MQKRELNSILTRSAVENNSAGREVRREMELAMQAGQANPDPAVQAMWNSIPRKGPRLTLEEFVAYLAKKASMS